MNDLQRATLHARLRWVGAPLLLTGLLLFLAALTQAIGPAPWTLVPHALLGSGLALASFGANHDTALALAQRMVEAGHRPPAPLDEELAAAVAADRAGTLALRPAPTVGLVIPVLALLVQLGLGWRLVGG